MQKLKQINLVVFGKSASCHHKEVRKYASKHPKIPVVDFVCVCVQSTYKAQLHCLLFLFILTDAFLILTT